MTVGTSRVKALPMGARISVLALRSSELLAVVDLDFR
jgi:hypothetical protein